MRVAIFTDTFLPEVNGVAKTLGRWVRFLESQGVECRVFAPETPGMYPDMNRPQLVQRFYSLPLLFYPECKLAIPNPVQLKRTLDAFRPTLIHVATPFNMGLSGLHYARSRRIPVVASYHTHFDRYLSHYKLQWLEPMFWKYMLWFHRECCKIYVPSRSTLEHLAHKGFAGLEIWGRGVDTGRFRPTDRRREILQARGVDPDRFVYLYVGRMAAEKSVDVLFEAYARLPERIRANSSLVLAGDGPLHREFQERYRRDPHIHFLGFVQGAALEEVYAAADCFVFPSATETFGNVVLESMASGTPVIGADSGGVGDSVSDGQTGLLCTPGNAEAFAKAMMRMHDRPSLRESLAAAGRKHALRQSWTYIFLRLLESYKEAESVGFSRQDGERLARIKPSPEVRARFQQKERKTMKMR